MSGIERGVFRDFPRRTQLCAVTSELNFSLGNFYSRDKIEDIYISTKSQDFEEYLTFRGINSFDVDGSFLTCRSFGTFTEIKISRGVFFSQMEFH